MAGGPPEFPIIAHSSFAESVIGLQQNKSSACPPESTIRLSGFCILKAWQRQ